MRAALARTRTDLAQGSPYLLGSFTDADIVMAMLLQSVVPVAQRFIRLGSATRRVWTSPALAAESADVIAWRDQLYERHRGRASSPAALGVPSSPSAPP